MAYEIVPLEAFEETFMSNIGVYCIKYLIPPLTRCTQNSLALRSPEV